MRHVGMVVTVKLRVVGIDLSLTSTGVSDGLIHRAFRTSPRTPLEARLEEIRGQVRGFATSLRVADLAVIEAPAYSRSGPGHEELAALRGVVRHMLWMRRIPFALVPPSTLKLYTTGYGAASKQDMVKAVDARYGSQMAVQRVCEGRWDMADALALAAMGYDHLGHPLPTATGAYEPHRDSLDAVRWPELLSE